MFEYCKRNWKWVILFFFIYMAVYGLAIFRFGKSVEDCGHILLPGSEMVWSYFAATRWMLAIWRWLFGGSIPFASGIVAGLILSISVLLQTYLFKLKEKLPIITYAVFYFCCMQWCYVMRYAMLSDAMAFGILCATLAAILLREPAPHHKSACMLLAVSLGVYQTLGFYFIALWLAAELAHADDSGQSPPLKRLLAGIGVCAGGVVIWFALNKLFIIVSGCPQRWLNAAAAYNANQTNWPQLLSCDLGTFPRAVAHHILEEGVRFPLLCLAGQKHIGQWIYTTSLIPLLILTIGYWRHMPRKKAFLMSFYAASLVYVPLCIALALLWSWASPRVMVAEPLAVAALWGIMLTRAPRMGIASAFLACFIALKGIYYGSSFAHDEAYYWNAAMQELRDMEERGRQLAIANGMTDTPVIILGKAPEPESQSGILFRMKDNGFLPGQSNPVALNLGREVFDGYARYMRLDRIRMGSDADKEKHQEAYREMPAWPKDGSIRIDKGEIIVKAG